MVSGDNLAPQGLGTLQLCRFRADRDWICRSYRVFGGVAVDVIADERVDLLASQVAAFESASG